MKIMRPTILAISLCVFIPLMSFAGNLFDSNGYGVYQKVIDGQSLYVVTDDGFQNNDDFKDIYHYDVYMPEILAAVINGKVYNVSTEHIAYYDELIKHNRSLLNQAELSQFKASTLGNERTREIKGNILFIVFAFLYSGRENEAWSELSNMWPNSDFERMKSAIVKAKSKGSLRLFK